MEDAIVYLMHRAHSYLDKGNGAVRIMFFYFSSAFNTIQHLRLSDNLLQMDVNIHLVSWITDYLTERPQFIRLKDCVSETVLCSTGVSVQDGAEDGCLGGSVRCVLSCFVC